MVSLPSDNDDFENAPSSLCATDDEEVSCDDMDDNVSDFDIDPTALKIYSQDFLVDVSAEMGSFMLPTGSNERECQTMDEVADNTSSTNQT